MKNNNDNINNAILNFYNAPHLRLNKNIIDTYGIDVALWIADIFSRWDYFRKEGKLEGGYFFITQEKIRESTKLNFSKQTSIIKLLTKEKIIKVQRKGIPAKNWYKINTMILISKMEDSRSKFLEIEGTSSVKSKDIYNKDSLQESFNNFNKNNIYTLFLEKWNEQKIILHKKITSKKLSSIKKALKDFSQEEIFKSFQNYATVLHSPEYFWNYTWTMEDFLQRGLHKFVNEAKPLTAFLNNSPPTKTRQRNPLQSNPEINPRVNPTRESLNLFPHEKVEDFFPEYNSLVEQWYNSGVWLKNYDPDKDTIFAAMVEAKQWINNRIDDNGFKVKYRLGTLQQVCNEYIDWIQRQSWLDEPGREIRDTNILFPNNGLFKLFMKSFEGDIGNTAIRSRGWGDDENLSIESPINIVKRKEIEKEDGERARKKREEEKEISKTNIKYAHECMKKYLSDFSLEDSEDIDGKYGEIIQQWIREKDNWENEFKKFIMDMEKKHQENPGAPNKSYIFLINRFGRI